MEDCYLYCNISSCRKQITEKAWLTRCLHVFCFEHGKIIFLVPSHQISCPVCDAINAKEVDIICCETNPHEMFLSGISPDRAMQLAKMSLKLWFHQLHSEKTYYINQLNTAVKKLHAHRSDSQKHYLNTKCKLENQLSSLQKAYNEIMQKYNETKSELESTKNKLYRYQRGYNALVDQGGGSRETALESGIDWIEQRRPPTPYFSAPSNSSNINLFS